VGDWLVLLGKGTPLIRHAQVHQLLHGPLQIGGIRKHIELRLVIHTVPDNHILASGGHRSSDREQQPTVKGDLEEAQHLSPQRAIRQIADPWESHGEEGTTRMRMFFRLQARCNALRK